MYPRLELPIFSTPHSSFCFTPAFLSLHLSQFTSVFLLDKFLLHVCGNYIVCKVASLSLSLSIRKMLGKRCPSSMTVPSDWLKSATHLWPEIAGTSCLTIIKYTSVSIDIQVINIMHMSCTCRNLFMSISCFIGCGQQ